MNTKLIRKIHKALREMGYSKNGREGKKYNSWLWQDKRGMTVSIHELRCVSINKSEEGLLFLAMQLEKHGLYIGGNSMQHYLYFDFSKCETK
jgi:hypothetical protein